MTAPVRLAGHALVNEGAAHERRTVHIDTVVFVRTRARTGFAVCSCGEQSPVLPSTGRRKQWHRDHKAAIREAQA